MKTLKKLFSVSAIVALLGTLAPMYAFGAGNSLDLDPEFPAAYAYAYANGITTQSEANVDMGGKLTRIAMAKMIAKYAINVLKLTPDTSKACTFADVTAALDTQYNNGVTLACQLGLMGQNMPENKFRPNDLVTRAEFGTTLSRAMNANSDDLATMNAANPYYKDHLNFLNAEGIMTKIDNPSMQEVRGYVMLMMMRADENYTAVEGCSAEELLACFNADDYDACIAKCADEPEEPGEEEEVKAGNLTITVKGSNGNLFIGRDSELDGLTIKASEEITVNKITLERIGYSTATDIDTVRLENDNGAKITEPKSLDSKGQAKLTIKKDYKVVDGTLNAVVVVKTKSTFTPGSTVGFKVVDVDSSAEKVTLPTNAYTYTAIAYDGSKVTITSRPVAKTYNYLAGEKYVVAKFKVETPDDSSIVLKGFTLKNKNGAGYVDLKKYFESAEVTVAGDAVKSLSANVNKNDEFVVSFKDEEIPAKGKAEVIVSIALSDDFDGYTEAVDLDITDVVAVDGKVSSRVSTNIPTNGLNLGQTYTFNGSKVKLTNVKLGNVDAAQNSEDIKVAEGNIEIAEAIKGNLKVVASGKGIGAIKELTLSINGEEYDASVSDYAFSAYPNTTSTTVMATGRATIGAIAGNNVTLTVTENSVSGWTGNYCILLNDSTAPRYQLYQSNCSTTVAGVFVEPVAELVYNNIEIEKSGKIRFFLDTKDEATWNGESISLSTVDSSAFTNLIYDESGKPVSEIAGSISFSKVTIQNGKASLTNTATKDVEFLNNETNRKVVFDGIYTAKKGDTNLNSFSLVGTNPTPNKVTFYLIINGEEVADALVAGTTATDTFNDILIENGKTGSVVVEAEIEGKATTTPANLGQFSLTIDGEDVNGNTVSTAPVKTAKMIVVDKGSLTISSTLKDTVLKAAAAQEIAVFTVKPANGASETYLEEISFKLTDGTNDIATLDADKITVTVDSVVVDDCSKDTTSKVYTCSLNEEVTSEGLDVKVTIDDKFVGKVVLGTLNVNGKPQSRTFTKRFEEAVVRIVAQQDMGGTTKFTLGVEADSDVTVSALKIKLDAGSLAAIPELAGYFNDGDTFEIAGIANVVQQITEISYSVNDVALATPIDKATYGDFFKVGDTYARVFKSN